MQNTLKKTTLSLWLLELEFTERLDEYQRIWTEVQGIYLTEKECDQVAESHRNEWYEPPFDTDVECLKTVYEIPIDEIEAAIAQAKRQHAA